MTIKMKIGKIEGLKIAICGDIMHSRVARSNIFICLTMMGAEVRVIAPSTLMPKEIHQFGVKVYTNMEDGLKDVDIIMMLKDAIRTNGWILYPIYKRIL